MARGPSTLRDLRRAIARICGAPRRARRPVASARRATRGGAGARRPARVRTSGGGAVRAPPAVRPALARMPRGGRLLVNGAGATWVVSPDGARRRIGASAGASWSPNGRFDRRLGRAGGSALAWRPDDDHALAYLDARRRARVVAVDSGREPGHEAARRRAGRAGVVARRGRNRAARTGAVASASAAGDERERRSPPPLLDEGSSVWASGRCPGRYPVGRRAGADVETAARR
jgi:hypothetical protein